MGEGMALAVEKKEGGGGDLGSKIVAACGPLRGTLRRRGAGPPRVIYGIVC